MKWHTSIIIRVFFSFSLRKKSWDIVNMLHLSSGRWWVTHVEHSCSKENQSGLMVVFECLVDFTQEMKEQNLFDRNETILL